MKSGFTHFCSALVAVLMVVLTGCSNTYHRRPDGTRVEGKCKRTEEAAASADCEYWNQLLGYQREDAERQRILGSMPAMCRPAGTIVVATRPAPRCRNQQEVSGPKTTMALLGVGAGLYLAYLLPFMLMDGEGPH